MTIAYLTSSAESVRQNEGIEITDVNNLYAANGTLMYDILQQWWCDAGTFESLQEAAVHMKDELP